MDGCVLGGRIYGIMGHHLIKLQMIMNIWQPTSPGS